MDNAGVVVAAGVLAVAVLGVVGKSMLTVEKPEPKERKQKKSKAEKRAEKAALVKEEDTAAEEAEEAAKEAKRAKKLEKERAKKAQKRADQERAASEGKKVAEKTEAPEVDAEEEKMSKEAAKKKKQKEKKAKAKKAKAAGGGNSGNSSHATVAVEADKPAVAEVTQVWEEVKVKKTKKKADVVEKADATFSCEIFIERAKFGLIVGPGGSTLRTITDATGCEIELPKEGGIRTDTLISGSPEGCARARKAISQLLEKGYSDITHAGTTDQKIAVPDNKRSVLIGPRGATIQMLQDKLNVKINMPEKGSDDDVSVMGDDGAVKEALSAIKQLISQGYSAVTHENYIKHEMEVPRDMIHLLFGPGGSVIRRIQDSTHTKINVPSEREGSIVLVTVLGELENVTEAKQEIRALLVAPPPTPIAPEWTQAASAHYVNAW